MKIYVSISASKRRQSLYLSYKDTLERQLHLVDNPYHADVALLLGAWDIKLFSLARKARQMGMPYVIVPLGDLSPWTRKHPMSRWWIKKGLYQKSLTRNAACLVATTPMEKVQLLKLGWNEDARMVRYPRFTRMATDQTLAEGIDTICLSVANDYRQRLTDQIARMSDNAICRQLLFIYARMSHRDIPREAIEELHKSLMADNYDEDELVAEIARLRLTSFAPALFQAMSQIAQLTEGFMPLPPKKGKLARRINRYVEQESEEKNVTTERANNENQQNDKP